MSDTTHEDVERIFREKFAELNHFEITAKEEFTPLVDVCAKYLIGVVPKPYSYICKVIDLISKGVIRSAISRGVAAALGLGIVFDTRLATNAAMESVLHWLERTNEQNPDKIAYIIDQNLRYWSIYYGEDYHFEDSSTLNRFEPDLEFKNYRK